MAGAAASAAGVSPRPFVLSRPQNANSRHQCPNGLPHLAGPSRRTPRHDSPFCLRTTTAPACPCKGLLRGPSSGKLPPELRRLPRRSSLHLSIRNSVSFFCFCGMIRSSPSSGNGVAQPLGGGKGRLDDAGVAFLTACPAPSVPWVAGTRVATGVSRCDLLRWGSRCEQTGKHRAALQGFR